MVREAEATVGLLHYVGMDSTQLHSQVVRAYSCTHISTEVAEIARMTARPPDFSAHVALPAGVKRGVFSRVGFVPLREPCVTWFRQANDYGNGSATSSDWSVWCVGKPMTRIKALSKEQRSYEIGLVVNPFDVIHRLKSGRYAFFYPEAS